jgi:dihydrofolate reductase
MISIIAALDEKNGIGLKGKLPWHISKDLKRFKSLTLGHCVIMGRKTFESIGKALPNRKNIVITKQSGISAKNVSIVNSLEEALEKAGKGEVFIIGGGEVFKQAIGKADKLYLTKVQGDFKCDTFFPDYSGFRQISEQKGESDGVKYSFVELVK